MITADEFLDACRARKFDFYTGVPCSFLTPLINRTICASNLDYIGAASEGEAVAIAAGAWLSGRNTVVMCQNSGLGNTINPLTSLNFPFRIPTLMVVSWRGEPGCHDEPQHELMGQITAEVFRVVRFAHAMFPSEPAAIGPALDTAVVAMKDKELPYAFIVSNGVVSGDSAPATNAVSPVRGLRIDLRHDGPLPHRAEILRRVIDSAPDAAAIIATTGKTGRELFTLADREQHLYLVGSMGCASAVGLGVALNTRRPVIVLDGDGAALMKLGTLATIGAMGPKNLIHVVLDNGVHDSTGGQATVSSTVDFANLALACNYQRAFSCNSEAGFVHAFTHALELSGPTLLHAHIRPGSMDKLGRPTVSPYDVARRFRSFVAANSTR